MGRFGAVNRLKGYGRKLHGRKQLALGMNLPGLSYFESQDILRDIRPRMQITPGSGAVYTAKIGWGVAVGDLSAPGVSHTPVTLDGAPIVSEFDGLTYGTWRGDANGNLLAGNSMGTGGARINQIIFTFPTYNSPARSSDGKWIVEFPSAVTITGLSATSIGTNKWLVTIPVGYNDTIRKITVTTTSVPDTGNITPIVYPAQDTTGSPNYTRTDLNPTNIFTVLEDSQWSSHFHIMRGLNVQPINSGNPPGSTPTAYAYRTAAQDTGYVIDFIGSADIVKLCNEIGIGNWCLASARDGYDCMVSKAAHFAGLVSENNAAEWDNETWNTKFSSTFESKVEGVRAGLDKIALTADPATATPVTVKTVPVQYSASNRTNIEVDLAENDLYATIQSGYSGIVYKALVSLAKATPTPLPLVWNANTAYPTVGTHVSDANNGDMTVYESILAVPANNNIAKTNTTYWKVSTRWTIWTTPSDFTKAGRHWKAIQTVTWWRLMDAAFLAVGKQRPKHVLNVQPVLDMTELFDMLSCNTGVTGAASGIAYATDNGYLYDLYDESAISAYMGAMGYSHLMTFQLNPTSWDGRCVSVGSPYQTDNWNMAEKQTLYDETVSGDVAVANCLDKLFAAINNVVDDALAFWFDPTYGRVKLEQDWWNANHPEKNHVVKVSSYEGNFQFTATTGWFDYNAAYNAGTTYSSTSIVTATPSGGVKEVYKSAQSGNIGHDPTTDNGTWWKRCSAAHNPTLPNTDVLTANPAIGSGQTTTVNGEPQQRVYALVHAAKRDARLGTALRRFHDGWKNNGGHWLVGFDAINQFPNQGGTLDEWGCRESEMDNNHPLWAACAVTKADWDLQP